MHQNENYGFIFHFILNKYSNLTFEFVTWSVASDSGTVCKVVLMAEDIS